MANLQSASEVGTSLEVFGQRQYNANEVHVKTESIGVLNIIINSSFDIPRSSSSIKVAIEAYM